MISKDSLAAHIIVYTVLCPHLQHNVEVLILKNNQNRKIPELTNSNSSHYCV